MTECKACNKGIFCPDHLTVRDIQNVEALWNTIRHFLVHSTSSEDARAEYRRLLARRLQHPEVGLAPEYGQQVLDMAAQRIAPRPKFKPPMCDCGKDYAHHDQMTGECVDTGCEMFTPV
jgi:hypothetical protein